MRRERQEGKEMVQDWLGERAVCDSVVCVDHLHRCKTSFCLVDGFVLCLLDFELCLQGAPGAWIGQVPTKTPIQCL